MHFSEDNLRSALRRTDPGESFTRRVLAHVEQNTARAAAPKRREIPMLQPWFSLHWRRALATAFLAVLVAGGAALIERGTIAQRRSGELAKQQAIEALRITSEKLNHVFDRVQASTSDHSKAGETTYDEN